MIHKQVLFNECQLLLKEGAEAEEEEGVKGKGVEDRKRTRRADCVSDQPCACPVPSRADGLHSGVFPHPLYILGVWEGPA